MEHIPVVQIDLSVPLKVPGEPYQTLRVALPQSPLRSSRNATLILSSPPVPFNNDLVPFPPTGLPMSDQYVKLEEERRQKERAEKKKKEKKKRKEKRSSRGKKHDSGPESEEDITPAHMVDIVTEEMPEVRLSLLKNFTGCRMFFFLLFKFTQPY